MNLLASSVLCRVAGMPVIDIESVCSALRREVTQVTELDVERLAEVLDALAASVDVTALGAGASAAEGGMPVPDEVQRRMLFACDILFSGGALEGVRAFVTRNLGPAGLLRLRLEAG